MSPRLTEVQIAALRPQITEYPERRLILPAYPPARRKRGLKLTEQETIGTEEPGALPAGGLTGAPSVKFWSISLFTNLIGHYIQRGSPRFAGPSLLHSFNGYMIQPASVSPFTPIQITISQSPVPTLDAGSSTSKPPGSPISTPAVRRIAAVPPLTHDSGFALTNDFTQAPISLPLGIFVSDEEWYVGVGLYADTNGSIGITGVFRVIENVPPESVGWV